MVRFFTTELFNNYCKILICIIVLYLFYYLLKYWKLWRVIRKIPGPTPLPLIGNAHQFKQIPTELFLQIAGFCNEFQKYGIFRLLIGSQPLVVVLKAEKLENIFNSNVHIIKSIEYNYLHPWLGTGLLTSTGEKWRFRRKLLTPAFHFQIMQDFLDVFCEQSEVLVNQLRQKAGQGQFNIFKYITLCALDIISEAAMGQKLFAQIQSGSEYVKAVYLMSEIVFNRMLKPWLWSDFLFQWIDRGKEHEKCLKILHDFTDKVICERSEKYHSKKLNRYENSKQKRLAFLDLLLESAEDGNILSKLDIREEVDTFMFEGHDTTAAGINWSVYLIGSFPQVQQRLHEEMDSIFEGSKRRPTMEDVKKMKYLECVIKESLRLFPSVPLYSRDLQDDMMIGDYFVPKNSTIVIAAYGVHRDPEYFPEPEEFKPERFLENNTKKHPFAYIPFSAGSRNCIGQRFAMLEEKVVLSYLLRNYHIESMQKREELLLLGQLILRPSDGLYVKLTQRL